MHGSWVINAYKWLFVFSCSSFVALIKHFFCYGEVIPHSSSLGPWEFRLVTPLQDNEHQAFILSPTAQEQCQNQLGVWVLIMWQSIKVNVLHYRCFKGNLTIYWTNVLNLGRVIESSIACLTNLYPCYHLLNMPTFPGSVQDHLSIKAWWS